MKKERGVSMIYRGEFSQELQITWQEARLKAPDLRYLQGAMFLDRPDLWSTRRKKARVLPLNGQIPFAMLFEVERVFGGKG